MAESLRVVPAYCKKQREALRESGIQRLASTHYVQLRPADRILHVAWFLPALSLYRAADAEGYQERAKHDLSQASALSQTRVGLRALGDDNEPSDYRHTLTTPFFRLALFRLHRLSTGLATGEPTYAAPLSIMFMILAR